jgi:hypothetical protein
LAKAKLREKKKNLNKWIRRREPEKKKKKKKNYKEVPPCMPGKVT